MPGRPGHQREISPNDPGVSIWVDGSITLVSLDMAVPVFGAFEGDAGFRIPGVWITSRERTAFPVLFFRVTGYAVL
jgi:hypothetical protein